MLLLQRHGFERDGSADRERDATHLTWRTRARIPAAMGAALDVPWKCSTQPSPLLVTVTWKHKCDSDKKESEMSAQMFSQSRSKRCCDTD